MAALVLKQNFVRAEAISSGGGRETPKHIDESEALHQKNESGAPLTAIYAPQSASRGSMDLVDPLRTVKSFLFGQLLHFDAVF